SEPHHFLPRSEIEELIEQIGMANDDLGEFVIDQADTFGGGSELFSLRLREQCGLQSKAFFPAQPRVGDDAGAVEYSSEFAVVDNSLRHNSSWERSRPRLPGFRRSHPPGSAAGDDACAPRVTAQASRKRGNAAVVENLSSPSRPGRSQPSPYAPARRSSCATF